MFVHEAPWDSWILGDPRVRLVRGSVASRADVQRVFDEGPIASVLNFETVTRDRGSGEDDFDGMLRVNTFGSLNLLEACRTQPQPVKFMFCSSCSVFRDHLPDPVSEATRRAPSSTYGTTKAMVELLLANYSARGFVDARASILPMCVSWRPDRRSREFLHDIIDDPYGSEPIVLGVDPDTRVFFNGWEVCIRNLLETHELPDVALGEERTLLQSGVSVTVREMLAALREAGEPHGLRLAEVQEAPDPETQAKVDAYNKYADFSLGRSLGLSQESLSQLAQGYAREYARLSVTTAQADAGRGS